MDVMTMYILAMVIGLFGGVAHQLHDSEEKNDVDKVGRAGVMGAIAGLLTVAIYPMSDPSTLTISTFIAGWFGDSVILNIVRRYRNS